MAMKLDLNIDGLHFRKNAGKNICIYKRRSDRSVGNCITRNFTICILPITLSSTGGISQMCVKFLV
jgi:hypothetical protein